MNDEAVTIVRFLQNPRLVVGNPRPGNPNQFLIKVSTD
jgi:hypothetical protein